jgi:NADH-quinone oxidoreductase subunit N
MSPTDIALLTPLMLLAGGVLTLLLLGAWKVNAKLIGGLSAAGFVALAWWMTVSPEVGGTQLITVMGAEVALAGFSPFTNLAQVAMLVLAAACVPLLASGLREAHRPEAYVLLGLAVVGGFLLSVSQDLLVFYLGLELMSFPLYILAAFRRDDARSSEAALKYFVLGGLVSGLMLFGLSLIYAMVGSTHYGAIQAAIAVGASPLLLVGCALVLVAVLFKLSVAPFHMWTPDVYEGSPTAVTAVMASLPKLAAAVALVRLLYGPMAGLVGVWQPALAGLAMLSMFGGAVLAIVQSSLKRLLAYSTIANIGFVLVGILAGSPAGAGAVMFYLFTYGLLQIGLFAVVLELEQAGLTRVSDLTGLAKRNLRLAVALPALLFSLAGVPPLVGFFAKLGVFGAAVGAGWTSVVIVGVVASVVACFYSLWLIKVMVFDVPADEAPVGEPWHGTLATVGVTCAALALLLGLLPNALWVLALPAGHAVF